MHKHSGCLVFFSFLLVLISLNFVSANVYYTDVYYTAPSKVYYPDEKIELKGYVYQSNYTNNGTRVSNSSSLANATVNFTIRHSNGTSVGNYTFTTDSIGAFYTRSNFYQNATEMNTSTINGTYYLRADYTDPNNSTSFSQVEILVVNQTIDMLKVSSDKATYGPSESMLVNVEAIRTIGDAILFVSNVSINGSLRNSTESILQTFNCTTGSNGKCTTNLTAPSANGDYILELNNYKTYSSFSVVPFFYTLYMKDDLGKSLKNVFAIGEQSRVEVKINNASSSDIYTFSGYIADSSGRSLKSITSTTLDNNNSFTNSFLFTVDAITFSYGTYSAHVTVAKTGGGNINSTTSFEIRDWALAVNKKTTNSGFEYGYNVFPNKTMFFEALPTYRANGSVIVGINSTSFTINLKDNLNNILTNATAVWNASCGKSGCYEFNLTSPLSIDEYSLFTTLTFNGDSQTETKVINVIGSVMSAQSTDKDGSLKELFGTNEYAYFSLSAYNASASSFNLSNAEIFLITYMNGTDYSYTQVNSPSLVNASNSVYEWAWNATSQRIKLDVPKAGGIYDVFLFGNNRTLGTTAKFIVNPYDACTVTKDTPGTVSTGYYYVWQFKTSDTVYFEIKLTQAINPLGKASALNSTNSSAYGMGSQCNVDTTTKQVISNATLTVIDAKNIESGASQNINVSASTCQSSDSSGGYTCTVKPLSKWDGGVNIVKIHIVGQDGTSSDIFSRFEARAFYLYGWASNWQNSPADNITLQLRLYEAGANWWSSYGSSGGISGTVIVKRIEYQGRDGEWIWPPVDSGYNATNVSSSTITSGIGSIILPASLTPSSSVWKTGNYRVVLQATTSKGDTDYGYAWFGVKLWDVYGQPVECTATGCNYKSYFNSKENITLYVKISRAGNYNYNYQGGENIWGNVTIGIKKIQNCRTWPCKDLNASEYNASTLNVNGSSPWYWGATLNQSRYLIQINKTSGSWGGGYYNVVLNVNGTDTGYAWFNTIAFYVDKQPVNSSGTGYKYSIRGSQPMYFNVTTTKSYKWGGSSSYNESDYINTTLDSAVLRVWDPQTYKSKEYNYPADINITPNIINGNRLINMTYNNGTWPSGYYSGELTLKNSENETSTGWLWFNVQPFRVQISTIGNTYNYDSDVCVNATLFIYDPDWYSNTLFSGNYSVISVVENIWSGGSYSIINYTNYTIGNFNGTTNRTFCPNNGTWTSGNWGGYHSLNVLVKDNIENDSQIGWLSFKTVPFQISWSGGGGNKATTQNVIVSLAVTKASSGANTTGNLTTLYQWRYDNYQSTREEYVFSVQNSSGATYCWSNVSQCTINGTANITIYPPSNGWRVGYNYIQSEWRKDSDSTQTVQDWSGVYFEGRESYNGYYDNVDANGNWKYYFGVNENITIRLNVRDASYGAAGVNITSVQYSTPSDSCWSEYCRTYTTATFSPNVTSSGSAILKIQFPSTNWTKGDTYIKATVSGSGGTATISGGMVRIKDMTLPNITISSPVNNATYSLNFSFSAATSKNAQCSIYVANYNNFYNWYCTGWNSTENATTITPQTLGACNTTYNYSGSAYYTEWISNGYHSMYDGVNYTWTSDTTGFTTGVKSHTYALNTTKWPTQHYGMQVWCYDTDNNYASALAAFKINNQ